MPALASPDVLQTAHVFCCRVVFAFRHYMQDAQDEVALWEHNFRQLSARHRALLHTQPAKYAAAKKAIHQNHLFITALLSSFDPDDNEDIATPSHLSHAGTAADDVAQHMQRVPPGDVEKVTRLADNWHRGSPPVMGNCLLHPPFDCNILGRRRG